MKASKRPPADGEAPRAHALRLMQQRILDGHWLPETRLPAEKKLAAEFGVCRTTIRAALADLGTLGLTEYHLNRGHLVRRVEPHARELLAQTIAVISDLAQKPQRRLFSGREMALESGVLDTIFGAGLNALTLHAELLDQAGVDRLMDNRPRGLVVTCRLEDSAATCALLARLTSHPAPKVFYGDDASLSPFDRVVSDHAGGTESLARWLISQGRRRILRLWTVPASVSWVQAHNAGYERALQACGIPSLPPVHVPGITRRVTDSREVFERRTREFAGHLAEHLSGPTPPDAIMVCTDCEVFPLAAACRLFGREPGRDILITGYDNVWHQAFERQWEPSVPAASVEKHNHRMGETLAQLLLDRMADRLPPAPQLRMVGQSLAITPAEVKPLAAAAVPASSEGELQHVGA